jgi:predicted O-linked N-acetylglucosamine transferase (SPINDLY family)
VSVEPNNLSATFASARALAAAGASVQSAELLRAAVAANPDCGEARIEFANLLAALGAKAEAIEHYRAAVASRPDALDWRCNLAALLAGAGRHTEAIAESVQILALDPGCATALFNLGSSQLALRQLGAAAESFARCAQLTPGDPRVHNNWGLALAAAGRWQEALAAYREALRLQPDYERALNNRASAFMSLQQFERALVDLDRALALEPRYTRALVNRGTALRTLGRHAEALESYRSAFPDPDALANATDLLIHDLRRKEEAFACAQALYRLAPDRDEVAGAYHAVAQATARWDDYDARIARILESVRAGGRPTSPFRCLYVADSPEDQYACARAAAERLAAAPPLWRGERYGHGRIRVGYLSSDFHAHATAYLMAGLFERHDRKRVECFAFAHGECPAADPMRERVAHAVEHFEDVEALSNAELAAHIRALEIDVLVDLKGYTGGSRMAVLRHRPAPIQVHFLGYPGTLGGGFVDYLIADHHVVPAAEAVHYSERVVRLPHTYQVTDDRRSAPHAWSRARAGLPAAGLVFGALHQAYKLTPAVFAVWMRLLRRLSGSTLWLLDHGPTVTERLCAVATAQGVEPRRLCFAPQLPQDEHLARLGAADLFLDTFPYGAHTTASDALWMGVPLVALCGRSFASRVSASIVRAAGRPDLVTHSLLEYEALIVGLCSEPGRLEDLRRDLDARVRRSPLFDTAGFTRALEDAYAALRSRHEAGLAPADLEVAPRSG